MGFRNPVTTASAVDTGQGDQANAGVRLYQDNTVPAVPIGIAEWRTGSMGRNSTVSLSGGVGGSSFYVDGGAASGLDAPAIALNVQSAPAGGYESVLAFDNYDRVEWLDGDPVNGGGSGFLAGSGADVPAGVQLIRKTFVGFVAGDASGNKVVNFPGGPFPNQLVAVHVESLPYPAGSMAAGYEWRTWGYSLSAVILRCFLGSAPVGSPTLGACVVAWGW